MRDRVGEYESQGKMWVMMQHEESKNPQFGLIIVRSSNFYILTKRTWFDLQFCVKD
jgi:hypothetical protein